MLYRLRSVGEHGQLNDTLLNFFNEYTLHDYQEQLQLTTTRVYIFPSQFYAKLATTGFEGVQRWKSISASSLINSVIFIPIHVPGHWLLTQWNIQKGPIVSLSLFDGIDEDTWLTTQHTEIAWTLRSYF
jgi:Ulp1 family protease